METSPGGFRQASLVQQGYDHAPDALAELSWALRFTPTLCMVGALVGLVTLEPAIHFSLAALGILPFWFPSAHPLDVFYNRAIRPIWNGVRLPPNPLPRRIACLMGGAMNLGIGFAIVLGSPPVAYALGAVLIALQIVVITTHFCVASWLYEGVLRAIGRWEKPIEPDRARSLVAEGALLVDVRTPAEFARAHLPGARNAPLDALPAALGEPLDRCVVLYCQSGLRSRSALGILRKHGYVNAHTAGGMGRIGEGPGPGR